MRTYLSLLAMIILLSACIKNDDESNNPKPDPETPAVFMPIKQGSYWVYEHYSIDTTGEEYFMDRFDSVVIQRDSVINGIKYAVLEGNAPSGSGWRVLNLLRDSSDCVVNKGGVPLFLPGNFVDTIKWEVYLDPHSADTMYTVLVQMRALPDNFTVPAGNFDVINTNGVITAHKLTHPEGYRTREMPLLYADGIGLVLDTYFWASQPNRFERRLVRYHIGEKK